MPVAEKPITPCLLVGEGPTRKDLAGALLELEVEEHYELACVFRVKFAIVREDDGMWTFLDQGAAAPWTKVELKLNVGGREELLVAGYVTEVRVHIAAAEGDSHIELVGMDTSCLMSLEEIVKDWPEKRDSEIAEKLFSKYGLDYTVEVVDVVHAVQATTILQRETDIQFLKRLARRNGFECAIEGKKGLFQKPDLKRKPLPVLAAHFGKETNLTAFDANWNAMRPTQVEAQRIDIATKQAQTVKVFENELTRLGKNGPPAPKIPEGGKTTTIVRHHVTTGIQEMRRLAEAVSEEASWFLEAKGEVDGIEYGDVLHARRRVPIKGVGEVLSGMYYLTSVRHLYTTDKYVQYFTARRNATTGQSSDFGSSSPFPF